MSEFKKYQRLPSYVELRPYIPGEDLRGIFVPTEVNPEDGDMIARDVGSYDMWFMTAEWYALHYDPKPVEA